jgi:hypothetical protein
MGHTAQNGVARYVKTNPPGSVPGMSCVPVMAYEAKIMLTIIMPANMI